MNGSMKKTFLALALACVFLTPTPAAAFFNLGGCAASGAGGAASGALAHARAVPITNTTLETSAVAQTTKECVLDGLASVLTQSLITATTNSIVTWINSGFEGGPAFITNYSVFLRGIANDTAVSFIQGSELGFLCSPFENPIRLALIRDYQRQNSFSQRISCSLGEGIGSGFFNGDFSQGGWQAFFRIATEPQNNPYYAYLDAQSERDNRIVSAQTETLRQTSSGGFLSKGECVFYGNAGLTYDENGVQTTVVTPNTHTAAGCAAQGGTWQVVTPGTTIETQLDHVLGSGLRQLELADEIDEVINALLAQLSQQIFTSLDGLRGLSSGSASSAVGGQSYLSRLSEDTDTGTFTQARTVLIDDISTAIDYEESYQDILGDVVAGYEAAQADFETAVNACNSSGNSTLGSTASQTLTGDITPALERYKALRASSIDRVSALVALRSSAQNATDATTLNTVADEYEALLASGAVQTSGDIAFLAQEASAEQETFAAFSAQRAGLSACGL